MNPFTKIYWNKIEHFIGSLKFAVIVISLFTIGMIIGTFLESYYGTEFANRMIYKSIPFMIIQLGIFLSIIFAATVRLPPKKRFYGFYTIHTGLIIIGIGSLITYIAGVDGSITLEPNEPNRQVVLSEDILKITYPNEGKQVTTFLPYSAFQTNINESYNNITVKEYIPFAEGTFTWKEAINKYPETLLVHSSKYHFKNAFAEQDLALSIHPEAGPDFQTTVNMGPLTFNYYPSTFARCFAIDNPSKVFIWNSETAECFTPEERHAEVKTSKNKTLFVTLTEKK